MFQKDTCNFMRMMNRNHPVLLFDGVCNLCNRSVQFIIKRDKKKRIRFASLQSDVGKSLLKQYAISTNQMESLVFIDNEKAYTRSAGVLRLMKYLHAPWNWLSFFRFVPVFIRDGVYNWVARKRYKWFGKKDECMVPTAEIRERFLE